MNRTIAICPACGRSAFAELGVIQRHGACRGAGWLLPPGAPELTKDDVDTIIEGIEHFVIGPQDPPDPELVEVWQPYIEKLRLVL